jgi:hypothetical protein
MVTGMLHEVLSECQHFLRTLELLHPAGSAAIIERRPALRMKRLCHPDVRNSTALRRESAISSPPSHLKIQLCRRTEVEHICRFEVLVGHAI